VLVGLTRLCPPLPARRPPPPHQVDGQAIATSDALLGALERYAVGDTVQLRIARVGDQVGGGGARG
jgi:hypothetical protein